jgi:hypothetical protein
LEETSAEELAKEKGNAISETGTQKPQHQTKKQTTTRFWWKSMQFKSIKEREV